MRYTADMKTTSFTVLPETDQALLREAAGRLAHSLNKVSNPRTSVIVTTASGKYFGNNIFLSNCTLLCGEASALSAAVAANDAHIEALYLTVGRADTQAPKIISPCGNCRQMLHDFASLNGKPIAVYSATSLLDDVMVTDSEELLPAGFKSASLGKMAESTITQAS
jgi:cytidine deaminase